MTLGSNSRSWMMDVIVDDTAEQSSSLAAAFSAIFHKMNLYLCDMKVAYRKGLGLGLTTKQLK